MANEIRVTICAPDYRERHIAEISLYSDESPPAGYDSTSYSIGEVTIENDQLQFEIYANEGNSCPSLNCSELIEAIKEGMSRLVEIYPQ